MWPGKQYTPIFWRAQVLDEDRGSGRIQTWDNGWGDHQKWVFEAVDVSKSEYRMQNFATKRYLTYDPAGNRFWGYRWCDTWNQILIKH